MNPPPTEKNPNQPQTPPTRNTPDKEEGRPSHQRPGGVPSEKRIHSEATPGEPLPGHKGPGRPLSLPH